MPAHWKKSENESSYSAESLESEGFIHCSFEDQVDIVLKRYYGGAGSVVILEIDPQQLTSELKIERSTNDEMYPHIYGEINREAVVKIRERKLN